MTKNKLNKGEIIIYQTSKKEVELKVLLKEETVWGNLNQIAKLFGVQKAAISKHLNNIYKDGELDKKATVSILETVQKEGKREIKRNIEYYNLDAMLSVGYRVNSKQATQFRIWATRILKNYLVKGYAINEKQLMEARNKFNELQTTISFLRKCFLLSFRNER